MSFIRKITIERFKSIKHLELQLKPVNIMIGVNGAGKSNLIKFFKLLDIIASGRDLDNYVTTKCGGANKLLYCGSKFSQNIIANIEFARKKALEIKLQHAVPDRLVFDDAIQFDVDNCKGLLNKLKNKLQDSQDLRGRFDYLMGKAKPKERRNFLLDIKVGDIELLRDVRQDYHAQKWYYISKLMPRDINSIIDKCSLLIYQLEDLRYLSQDSYNKLNLEIVSTFRMFLSDSAKEGIDNNIIDSWNALVSVSKAITGINEELHNFMLSQFSKAQSLGVESMVQDNITVIHLNDTSDTSPLVTGADGLQNRYLWSNGGNVAVILANLARDFLDVYKKIENEIKRIMPDFDSFAIMVNEGSYSEREKRNQNFMLQWRHKDIDMLEFGPQDFSDGSIRYIVLLTALLMPKAWCPKLLIIDEPELGLHPQAIKRLSQFIKLASENMQIIISTQSPDLLNCFSDDVSQVITVEKYGRESVFRQFNKKEASNLTRWMAKYQETVADLWHSNKLGANM